MNKQTLINSSPSGNTKTNTMGTLRPFELDPFDLLWRDLFETNSRFSAITQKVTHPVDIYETPQGIRFEVAAVGLDSKDIDIEIDGDQLRIKYEKQPQTDEDMAIYRGIKKSSFDLTWKIATKFDLSQLKASLDKGLLTLDIPVAEGKAIRKIEIETPKLVALP
jgi:HSP20 family protein